MPTATKPPPKDKPPHSGTVFVLGAGFSHAISSTMPLLKQLSEQVLENYKFKDQIPAAIRSLIEKDFEEAMSYLSQPKPWIRESEALQHRALYLELASVTAGVLNEAVYGTVLAMGMEPPKWLEQFIRFWHQDRSVVITLNYDTLIEEVAVELPLLGESGKDGGLGVHSIYPPILSDAASRTSSVLASPPIGTFRLLKLHGSTNWYYSGREPAYGETIYYLPARGVSSIWNDSDSASYVAKFAAVADKYPLIIPPVFDKALLLTHETMRSIWFKAGTALQRAKRVVFLGYSLPPSDRTMKHFLASSISPDATIEIVDLHDRSEHFSTMLPSLASKMKQSHLGTDSIEKCALGLGVPQAGA